MVYSLLIGLAVMLLCVLLAAAFLLGRHWRRPADAAEFLSAVTRQHIDLFQGGQLNEAAVETAKAQFREFLERGDLEAVEASLRPGTHFVVQVRALAEIGTDDAGRILERQLQRRLTSDLIEQSWYWIDLANGLRSLQREQSLPQLLRCTEAAGDHPLGHFFAAETICFLSFTRYLRQPNTQTGQAALRVLHRAMEGLRSGVRPQLIIEASLGELIEELWDQRPEDVSPLVVRVFVEALRILRRAPHAERLLGDEGTEHEAFSWQMARLASVESVLSDYLEETPQHLCTALATASPHEQRDILCALTDLHAESGATVLPLLDTSGFPHCELALSTLTWSRDPRVAPWLRQRFLRQVPLGQRGTKRLFFSSSRSSPLPSDFPYHAILRALRGHPSAETETLLLLAASERGAFYRVAALSSLGWWEPFDLGPVRGCLQGARRDPDAQVRQAARAALARLGERQALQWFRIALSGPEPARVHEAIQTVSDEGLLLLWPDLDRLADSEDLEVATHACEALERLREEFNFRT